MRSRRWVVFVAAAAVVLAASAALAVLLLGSGSAPARPAHATVVRSGAEPGERANVEAVTRLLTGLPAAFAAGRTDGLTPAFAARGTDLRQALPTGATVTVDPASWRRTGAVGSIAATVRPPGQAPARFLVVLMHESGGWKIAGTWPESDG